MKIPKYFSNDTIKSGIVTGIAVFLISLAILFLLVFLINLIFNNVFDLNIFKIMLLAAIPNLILMRNQFIKYKKEKNGKGILIVSFIIVFASVLLHELLK